MAKKPEDIANVLGSVPNVPEAPDTINTNIVPETPEVPEIPAANNAITNTLDSVSKPAIDKKLQQKELNKASKKVEGKKIKFKCSSVYAPLFPDGFVSTYQGKIINLIFDNRTLELSEAVYQYVTKKLEAKADKEAERLNKYYSKEQKFRGSFIAGD